MRTPPALRRAGALAIAAALLTAGGTATGLFTGVAEAATPSSVTPNAAPNSSTTATSFTLSGTGFTPLDTVSLTPTTPPPFPKETYSIPGTVTSGTSTTTLAFTATLTNAAPGDYDIKVTTGPNSGTCTACLTITNPGRPTVTAVAGNGAGVFTITGTNLAKGASVAFLKTDGTVDPAMTWTPGTDSTSNGQTTHTTGYTSSTTLKGVYGYNAATVTPGKHFLRVTNTDQQQSTPNTVEFWQPTITSVVPAALGQGATNFPVQINGAGIRTGSSMGFQQFSSSVTDISLGTATVAADNTSISAPVTVTSDATSELKRTASIVGPDGGYANLANALDVGLAPVIDGQSLSGVGQGGSVSRTITGTDFKPGVAFSTKTPGVTFVTNSVAAAGTSAVVTITAASDATVGAVTTVTVTNPDHGTSDYVDDGSGTVTPFTTPTLFSVNPAPKITKLTPGSTSAGTTKTVTISGSGFASGMTATFGPGISAGTVTVTNATTASVVTTADANAVPGPRDVVLTNSGDKGTSTCAQCFGIDTITVAPNAAANTASAFDLTVSRISSAPDLSDATSVTLSKRILAGDQPDITGTLSGTPTATGVTATFNLTNAAPGFYNVTVNRPGGAVSCFGCFRITGQTITVAAITPNKGGTGATNFPVTITGTNFSHGQIVTIAGVTVSSVKFVSPSSITALVTIPSSATPATGIDVVVQNADVANGGSQAKLAGGYAIVAGPTVTSASTATPDHKSLGQGASNQVVTINGTNFTAGSVAVFSGAGVTPGTPTLVNNKQITVPVTVATDAPLGDRTVTVTQSDNGGQSAAVTAITITAKPVPSLIAPASIIAGKAITVQVTGQGFQSASTLQIPDITFTNTVLNQDGSLSATATAAANAAPGGRAVAVINPDGGKGVCTCTFAVQVPTALTFTQSVGSSTAGNADTLSGVLTNANTGAGISGIGVLIHVVPVKGASTTPSVATQSNGGYALIAHPTYTTTFTAYFPGNATYAASSAPSKTVTEASRVTISSPGNGARSKASSVLVIKGIVQPNHAGSTIGLYSLGKDGKFHGIASSRIASNGSYAISVRLGKGVYTLRTGIGATTGNIAGNSPTIGVRRT